MKRFIIISFLLVITFVAKADIWLRVNMAETQPVELKIHDGMTVTVDNGQLIVNGNDITLALDKVLSFNYVAKGEGYVENAVIDAADKVLVSIHSLSGYRVDCDDNIENLSAGIYIIRYANGETIKMKLP